VDTVASALGIDDKAVRKAIPDLKPLFVARNEISHELDLQRLEKPGDRTRRSRPMGDTKKICDAGFRTGQQIVNAVNAILAAKSAA
jgi:predicted phosphoribosyltransferase